LVVVSGGAINKAVAATNVIVEKRVGRKKRRGLG
jgi:hypothetical protein